ncbi:MAG: hypothetical protein NZ853_10750 [Leptospiraceae bacterium]|nr:hypothetical protein [Leptospiraceae bacterium]MDW7977068.1 hypothetical protein [Leptospiraceae bacterium]
MEYHRRDVPFLKLNMRRKFLTFFLILFFPVYVKADVLEELVHQFQSSTFKAHLAIELNQQTIKGEIYYQKGNIHFRLNDGRVIAGNVKSILVFDPSTKVAGRQDREEGGGLSWILKYPYNIQGNKAIIEPPSKKPYEKIIITWNHNLFPTNIQFINKDKTLTYRFSQIVLLNNISSSMFSYKPPAGSRTVDNPLNLRN